MVLVYINYLYKDYDLEIDEDTDVNLLKDIIYNIEYKDFNHSDIIKKQIKKNMKIIYNEEQLPDNFKFNFKNLNPNGNSKNDMLNIDKIIGLGYDLKIIQKPIECINHS